MKREDANHRAIAIFAAMLAIATTLLSGCGGGTPAADEDSKPPANPTLLVSAAKAEVHPMTSELRLLGKTVATRHVIIRSPTAGRVTGMKLVSGDSVRKGQVVAHVVNREIEAAEAGLAVASKIDPQDAPRLTASVGRYNHSVGIPVVAPESGVVSQPPVTSGQMVADLDTLVDLIDPKSLYVDTSVPVSQLALVKPGMAATMTTPFRPGIEFPARIAAIMPSFDATSATSSVRTDFTGADRIAEAGAPVEVRVETASVPDAIVVPVAALFQDQGVDRYHVFVIGPDGKAHRTDVKVGLRDRDRVQVTEGIKVGDLVVISGGYALSDGLGVRVAQGNSMTRSSSTLAVLSVLAASVLGIILARTIPSAVFPEIIFRRATVLAESGDLPADQMLASVTRPLEESAYSIPGVQLVRSTTTRGSAEIDVTFGEDSDPQVGFQMLSAAVAHTRASLPADTSVDAVLLTTGTFPIVDLSLSSKTRSLPELTDVINYDLVPSLHRIDGTYRVGVIGGKYREFVVRLDPARMLQHDMSPADVVAGLTENNVVASAGRMNESHRMLLTVVTTDLHQADQIAAVPLSSVGGQPVRVSDIGSVELGIQEDYVRAASENGAAVLVGISRRPSGSTEEIAAQARQILQEFRQRYPDIQFSISYDQSDLVAESLKSVRDAIVLGLVLSVLVVLAFTMSPLSALVAAIVVPCTVAITFIVMKAVGLTFNMMTLGGLAAGIGLFIDDAIVMIEAIHRELSAKKSAAEAVAGALKSLQRPLVASTMTVIVVFGPLVFTSGVTGIFFRSLAATLGGGLAISLILAIYFTPAIELAIARFRGRAREAGRIYHAVQTGFLTAVRPFIRIPVLAIPVAIVSLIVAYLVYNNIGTDYLPPLDEGAFILDYVTPPQSTLADTTAMLDSIQSILKSTPEVTSYSRRTGTQLGFFLTESNTGDISVRLKPDRKRSIDEVTNSIRERILNTVPGVQVEFSQVLQDLIGDLSGVPEPIEVKVFGTDQKVIEATARQVADKMRSIHGLVDVKNGIIESIPEEAVVVDNTSAAHYGLNADDVRTALDSVIQGTVATSVLSGDRLVNLRVRYPDAFHEDLGTLSEVVLKSSTNARVPLSSVTKLNFLGATNEIDRERQRPVVHVTGRLEGIDLGTGINAVKDSLSKMPLPAGVSLEYGGLYAQQQQAFHELALVLVAGTFMMFLILVWEFARLAPALACLIAAMSCLAGSFIALDLTGMTLNISSFMGIIMVAGITAKNGILLLDHAEREVGSGTKPGAALLDAATVRLRPIMMTTLATAAGLFPLALGYGAGAKVQQPLAIAVIGGLAFAMFLSTPLAGGIYLMGTRSSRSTEDRAP